MIAGKFTGILFKKMIEPEKEYIVFAEIGRRFTFELRSLRLRKDYNQPHLKAVKELQFSTFSKLEFEEGDKIVFRGNDYIIENVQEKESGFALLHFVKEVVAIR